MITWGLCLRSSPHTTVSSPLLFSPPSLSVFPISFTLSLSTPMGGQHLPGDLTIPCFSSLTLCILAVRGIGGKSLQIVLEQKLIAGHPLHRLQHVVLQCQAPTHLLFLGSRQGYPLI